MVHTDDSDIKLGCKKWE